MDQDVRTQRTRVELRFPGAPDFLRLARLTTADAAGRAGFGVDEIDDLRIAVSELCALVGGEGVEITLAFDAEPGALAIEGRGGPGLLEGENAEMAQALVRALVDECDLSTDGSEVTFRVRKRTTAG